MDKFLNKQQEVIQELIETKVYDDLTLLERNLVLSEMTEDEYRLRALAISEARFVYADVEPRPLVLEKQRKGILVPIPLWQAAASVAAAVIVSFFVFRTNDTVVIEKEVPLMAAADTIYLERNIVDTVVEYRTLFIDKTSASVEKDLMASKVNNEAVELNNNSNNSAQVLADLDPEKLVNKGKSLANDETFSLIDGLVMPN
jgi:hypothetical protein